MDIQSAPPRHNPTANFAVGEVCYRAILSRDCPLEHTYLHEPIEPEEETQLAWFREHLKIAARRQELMSTIKALTEEKAAIDAKLLAIVRTEAEAIAELESLVNDAVKHGVNVWVKQASK